MNEKVSKRITVFLFAILIFVYSVLQANAFLFGDRTVSFNDVIITSVTGFPKKMNKYASEKVTFDVTAYPTGVKRQVCLQLYKSEKGRFVTVGKYETDGAGNRLKITVPDKYRKKTVGMWRLYIPEERYCTAYEAECTLTTANVKGCPLYAKTACVYCIETGQVIFGKKTTAKLKQASTTKIMSAVILLESGKIKGETKISGNAVDTYDANLYMKAGDKYKNTDLLYAMMIQSSNDAAEAIAEGVAGSEKKFVSLMNKKAKSLGLTSTAFANPHGLNADGHYTTAKELALLTGYAYTSSKLFQKVFNTQKYSFESLKFKEKKTVYTTDKMGFHKNHCGGKTGFTTPSGCCYASVYKHGGKTYVVTELNASSSKARWTDIINLYNYIDAYAGDTY